MTKQCFIMVGIPGSGKSTAIKKVVEQFKVKTFSVFSLDACRIKFFQKRVGSGARAAHTDSKLMYTLAFEYVTAYSKEFDKFVDDEWSKALSSQTLFVDNTNLTRKSRSRWCQSARQAKFNVYGVEVMTPLQTALDRQSTRQDKTVPHNVIRRMHMQQEGLMLGSEVDDLLFIDGTV